MQYSGLGDLARYFASSNTNLEIRSRLDGLSRELSTGLKLDPSRDLGAEGARVTQVGRQLALVARQVSSAGQIADRLAVMQAGLGNLSNLGATLLEQLNSLGQSSGNSWRQDASRLGQVAIEDTVSTLNTRFAGAFLFSGVSEDVPSLVSASDIIDSIRLDIAGVTTADDLVAAVDEWFTEPGGGFEIVAYQGDDGEFPERRIDDLTSIRIEARADSEAIRELMKGAALAYFADGSSVLLPDSERDLVVARATEVLFGASSDLAELSGRLGQSEHRVDDAKARLVAEQTSLSIMQGSLLSADPFETASMLEQVQLQLETHYLVTARLSQLTLTRYL